MYLQHFFCFGILITFLVQYGCSRLRINRQQEEKCMNFIFNRLKGVNRGYESSIRRVPADRSHIIKALYKDNDGEIGGKNKDAPRYEARGVSANKHEIRSAISSSVNGIQDAKGLFPGAFCKIMPDIFTNDPNYALVMHADGVGSKSALAYMYWKETGDLSVWKNIAQDAIIMNIDDVMCVGAGLTNPSVFTSTIARNKHLIPMEVITAIMQGIVEVIESLRPWGINLNLAGGETADLGDVVRTLSLDCTLTSRMKRSNVIDNARISAGNIIVGFASSGQTVYEETYNSGIGSNGLTSARHDVLSSEYASKYPETFAPTLPPSMVYSGSKKLTDEVTVVSSGRKEEERFTVGELLLSPTRSYAPFLHQIFKTEEGADSLKRSFPRHHIHGIIHCTGGGQTKILSSLYKSHQQPKSSSSSSSSGSNNHPSPLHIIKDSLFETPAIFQLIQQESGTPWQEMYQVFNMGHRLEMYVENKEVAKELISRAQELGLEGRIIGRVEEGGVKQQQQQQQQQQHSMTIRGEHGEFYYN